MNVTEKPSIATGIVEFILPGGRIFATGNVDFGMKQANPRNGRGRSLEWFRQKLCNWALAHMPRAE